MTLDESEPFDGDPLSLNVANGKLTFINHRAIGFRFTRHVSFVDICCDVKYNPAARSPSLQKFLSYVLPDAAARTHLQTFFGSCLTGLTQERKMLLLHGAGPCGKTTLIKLFEEILGSYASKLRSFNWPERGEIQHLVEPHTRFLYATEPLTSSKDLDLRKVFSGHMMIKPSWHQQEGGSFEFKPHFKMIMESCRPVAERFKGVENYIDPIEFSRVPDGQLDQNMLEKLLAEKEGALNWALQGAVNYIADKLPVTA